MGNDKYNLENVAVCIRNLCKIYDNGPPILKSFCMNVRKGEIYGLLGSSGCGKTTILSCIVGLKKWDSGDVLVFGKKPGTIESGIPGRRLGYMPQEVALYNHLSILEMIQYYGRIYNMKSTEILDRWAFLIKLLDLPSKFKLIEDLSGGQKRRASLALALVHSPELLVLDEPTVGLDPLLRKSIWNHLYKMVSTLGTTIIITTHYIEEARNSNTIGVMRKGRLIVENTPNALLKRQNCELLEQAILQLCHMNENSLKTMATDLDKEGRKNEFKSNWNDNIQPNSYGVSKNENQFVHGVFRSTPAFDCEMNQGSQRNDQGMEIFGTLRDTQLYQTLRRIYGLTTVILLTFHRFPWFLVMLLLIPFVQSSLSLFTAGCIPRDLGFGIVNYELTNWTQECNLPRHSDNSCDLSVLSCKYLNRLKNDDLLVLNAYNSEEEALAQVHLGNAWGYLIFPYNYSQHTVDRAAGRQFALNESIEGSQVHVHIDYSQSVTSYFLVKNLFRFYMEYIKSLADSCDLGGKLLEIPLDYRTPVYGSFDDNYTTFLIPGVILAAIFGIASFMTSLIIVADRKQGTLNRARVAGLTTIDIIASNLITQGIITIGQIIIMNGILNLFFDFVNLGSQWLSLLLCFLTGLSAVGLGFVVGMMCGTEVEVLVFGIFLIPIFFLPGGVIYPAEYMHRFLQYTRYIIPIALPIDSFRAIMIRGLGITHPLVWPGFLVLIAMIALMPIYDVLAYRIFHD